MSQLDLTAAVEAAARAAFEHDQTLRANSADKAWEDIHPILRDDWRATGRVSIAAALPALREQIAREELERAAQRIDGLIAAFEVPEEWVEAIDAFKDAAAVVRGEVTGQ